MTTRFHEDVNLRTATTRDLGLAAMLGSTRAAVLVTLREPTPTGVIAKHLGISPSTASMHTSALRDARLIESHRRGKTVEHRLTHLGASMLMGAR